MFFINKKCVFLICLSLLLLPIRATMAMTPTENQSMIDTRIQHAIELMRSYAERTGLTADKPHKRYLWTDAFAVCNYLGLARATNNADFKELALRLVDQVHDTLGRHRQDDRRDGWISGLSPEQGTLHPTLGGLRIGKPLAERGPDEPFDAQLEWERDGQYFHYLTKWMHALDQLTRATGDQRYNLWARELAARAFTAFSNTTSTNQPPYQMVWKKSIDLTRTLVPSMGKHDPLDGYITSLQLIGTANVVRSAAISPNLDDEINAFADMVRGGEWTTDDPLGLGGLLIDAYRLQQLQEQGLQTQPQLLENLLDAAIAGLRYYLRSGELEQAPLYRLAFRELGLAIGLHAVSRLQQRIDNSEQQYHSHTRLQGQIDKLMQYSELREHILNFWLAPEHQRTQTWLEHRDINEVMLATSLAPDGLLELSVPGAKRP
jgi:hypothetical protein